jgi:Tfp pilus assembly protein FimT
MTSPFMVLALVSALAVFAVVVFVAVVVGIHSESHHQEMATRAQRPLAVMVRRLLGVYVGKPADADADDIREECLTGNSTDWWNKGGWDR